ncbi:nucleotidyltransferase family protein [Rouxiella badensis]|jgi:molybdenum cofactor cytidylyltransferase|uniref:nucleotidyltransferase family protein n=1 Tax=Rouxiella badensis TaxID=1646377 RepID=UPI001B566B99|nr:nucleotidyltransferase family protein [Rouxiella badensis]MCC3749009.1 nucleotidyltransferase family protein [Rouxiella badensis]
MTKPGVVLLAAGKSQRFRAATGRHKLLETLKNSSLTVFEQSLENIQRSELDIQVVLRPEDVMLQDFCQRAAVPYLCLESEGMGDSIAAGVRARADWSGWIIALADMPFIKPEIFVAVAQSVQQGQCARPVYRGQVGHPVGFPLTMRHPLGALCGDEGARGLLKAHPPWLIETQHAGCLWDIDVPQI